MNFLLSLILTLLIEGIIALLWGLRRRELVLCALVNIMTNPAAVLLHTMFPAWPVTALIELGVFAVEGFCYARFPVRRPWGLSLTANAVSFGAGLLINLFL